jgi:hypothetical protein
MTGNGDKEIQRLLKEVIPPVDRELRRDLWPAMLRRLEEPRPSLPWYDWAVITALGCWLVFFPDGILQLLYHL